MQAATSTASSVQASTAPGASSSFKDVVAATTQSTQNGSGQKPVSAPVSTPAATGSAAVKTDALQKPVAKAAEKKPAGDATAATGAVLPDATMTPVVTAPVVVPSPALAAGFTTPAAKGSDSEGAVFPRAAGSQDSRTTAAAGADENAGQQDTAVDPSTSGVVDSNPTVQSGAAQDGGAQASGVQGVDAQNLLAFAVPFSGVQAMPAATAVSDAASTVKKASALNAGTSSGQAAATVPAALPIAAPVETMPPALQAFSGVERPAAADIKTSSAPILKVANSTVPRGSIGRQKDAAVAHAGGSSDVVSGGVTRKNTDGSLDSSPSGSSDFQKAVKAAANDAVSAVGGATSATNASGQPAMPQSVAQAGQQSMPQTIDTAAAKAGHDGGLATAAASASAAGATTATASTPGLSSAQLVQSMRGSEMRIGMHSEEFGNISINTSLTHQSLAAQISFDHAELGKAMAVHVPAMQEKLGSAYGVQTRVEVRDGQAAFGGNAGQGAGQNPRGQGRSSNAGTTFSADGTGNVTDTTTYAPISAYDSSTRLDIRI